MEELKAGQAARIVGINIETLRHYENIGLMPEPKKKESGYRVYNANDIKRLRFIKHSKDLGFTLKEIKELLHLKISSGSKCGEVKLLAENKLNDIEKRINALTDIRSVLEKLVTQCTYNEISTTECPILEVIESKSIKN